MTQTNGIQKGASNTGIAYETVTAYFGPCAKVNTRTEVCPSGAFEGQTATSTPIRSPQAAAYQACDRLVMLSSLNLSCVQVETESGVLSFPSVSPLTGEQSQSPPRSLNSEP